MQAASVPAAPGGSGGGRSLETNAGWGSVTAPAPDWATGPAVSPPAQPAPAARPAVTTGPTAGARSGATAVRESLGAARRGGVQAPGDTATPPVPVTDDAAVSDDDEDIELSGDVGRAVIEKVLGGRVISEIDD